MTPFGDRMRKLRAERNVTLKDMAEALGVSSAYLSALEHGKRGRPGARTGRSPPPRSVPSRSRSW